MRYIDEFRDGFSGTYETFHDIMELSLEAREQGADLDAIVDGEFPELEAMYHDLKETYEDVTGLDYADVNPSEFLDDPSAYLSLPKVAGMLCGSVRARFLDGDLWEEGSQYWRDNLDFPEPEFFEED